MEEITRQLQPTLTLFGSFEKALKDLHEWQLGFWSNGSGRPPGQFQTRIKQDDERYHRLETETKGQSLILTEVRDFMIGQVEARKAREEAEQKHAERVRKAVLVAKWAAGAIFALLSWGAAKAIPVVKILVDDYLRAHPYVSKQLRDKASNDGPALSYENNPEQSAHW